MPQSWRNKISGVLDGIFPLPFFFLKKEVGSENWSLQIRSEVTKNAFWPKTVKTWMIPSKVCFRTTSEREAGGEMPGTAVKAWHVSATLNARHAAFNAYGLRSHRRWTSRYGSGGRWWLWGVFGFCFCWEEMWRGSLISAHILGGWMFFFCFFLLGIFNDLLGMYVMEHTARL